MVTAMVGHHAVESPLHDPDDIPRETVERYRDDELSVFEWFCPNCEGWLGWPDQTDHAVRI